MKSNTFLKLNFATMALITSTIMSNAQINKTIYQIEKDKVIQGKYLAKAHNDFQISSNYESPANLYQSSDISFKFAINGRDIMQLIDMLRLH